MFGILQDIIYNLLINDFWSGEYMFNFLDSSEKRKAFKIAYNEIKKENSIKSNSPKVAPITGDKEYSPRYTGAYNKPASDVVDMKHFKDWRKTTKVASNNPIYKDDLFKSPLIMNDDEPEQKPIKSVFSTPNKRTNALDFLSDDKGSEMTLDTDFDSYVTNKKDKPKEEKKTYSKEEIASAKNAFASLLSNSEKPKSKEQQESSNANRSTPFVFAEPKKSLPEVKVEVEEDKPGLRAIKKEDSIQSQANKRPFVFEMAVEKKVETQPKVAEVKEQPALPEFKVAPAIVVPEAKPLPKTTTPVQKKPVNRKPRGKNKRRFDADVIGSVDWR